MENKKVQTTTKMAIYKFILEFVVGNGALTVNGKTITRYCYTLGINYICFNPCPINLQYRTYNLEHSYTVVEVCRKY